VKLYFTARNNIGSRLIRWATNGDVSHVAIGFGGAVFHSTEHGFVVQGFESFAAEFDIVRALTFDIPDAEACLAFTSVLPKNTSYDYTAFAYFAYRLLLEKLLGDSSPTRNRFNSAGFLCTEMVGVACEVAERLGCGPLIPKGVDLSMTTPIDLYYYLCEKSDQIYEEKNETKK
jgi:hypothetical protein